MKCRCGHRFEFEQRARLKTSFAVIADANYGRFLSREQKVMAAKTREERLSAIAKSARLIGSLRTCPSCERLVFVHPGGETVEYFRREE